MSLFEGYGEIRFTDNYGNECNIQASSACMEEAIWVGIINPNPIIKAQDAIKMGLRLPPNTEKNPLTGEYCGWIPFPVPNEVLIHSRMNLTREQARNIGKLLLKFADEGFNK